MIHIELFIYLNKICAPFHLTLRSLAKLPKAVQVLLIIQKLKCLINNFLKSQNPAIWVKAVFSAETAKLLFCEVQPYALT